MYSNIVVKGMVSIFARTTDKIDVPDPLVVEDLISDKLNNRWKLARMITQHNNIFSNISEGTAFPLQVVLLCNTLKVRKAMSFELLENIFLYCVTSLANFCPLSWPCWEFVLVCYWMYFQTCSSSCWLSCKAFFWFVKSSGLCISLHNLGPTVVTDAKHMSGAWTSGGSQPAQPGTRVADYVKAGGESYNAFLNNCHDASGRMMNVGKGKR